MIANDKGGGTVPSGGRSGLKNGLKIIVPGADQDGAFEIERHGLASLDQKILTVAHVLKGPTYPPATNNHGRDNLGGGSGGGHGHGSESAGGVNRSGYREVESERARE